LGGRSHRDGLLLKLLEMMMVLRMRNLDLRGLLIEILRGF